MGSNYTNNLGLRKPEYKDPATFNAWDVPVNDNMDKIDTAFGNRNYTEQNYIANADSHTASIDKLDMSLKDVADLAPTLAQHDALTGEGTPSITNLYVTNSYVRMPRKETLFPEFQCSAFALPSSGGSTGALSTNAESEGVFLYHFYKWLSAEVGAIQSYLIVIQWKVPETFVSWNTKALTVDICTKEALITNNKVNVTIRQDGSYTAPILIIDKFSDVATIWNSERKGNELIAFTDANMASIGAVGGSTLNITIGMYSWKDAYVKIGAITLQYIG